MTVIGYFAMALAFNIVMRVYLQRDFWVKVLETAHVHGIGPRRMSGPAANSQALWVRALLTGSTSRGSRRERIARAN